MDVITWLNPLCSKAPADEFEYYWTRYIKKVNMKCNLNLTLGCKREPTYLIYWINSGAFTISCEECLGHGMSTITGYSKYATAKLHASSSLICPEKALITNVDINHCHIARLELKPPVDMLWKSM